MIPQGKVVHPPETEQFFQFAQALVGKRVQISDKLENLNLIQDVCKRNGTFYVLHCGDTSPESIWDILWIGDISNTLPSGNVRLAYSRALRELNRDNTAEILAIAKNNGWEKVEDWLVEPVAPRARARLIARSRRYRTGP